MKTLHLTLKKKWFDMILSGEKKEEYREMKDYWYRRLTNLFDIDKFKDYAAIKYDTITFKNGYSKDAPEIVIEYVSLSEGAGAKEWGAPTEHVFILKLGKILSTKNINP